ncbi:DinB family protein [Actinospongicola halichondriae]|uniref:DinB family protein n=1 Tax=Actinospongicola halichondriae TaxID=3236844 RepID=UPI003D4A7B35
MTDPCPECQFDGDSVEDVAGEIDALGRKYGAPLTRFLPGEDGPALLRTRPAPDVWSPLEYACHVRDVLGLFEERTRLMADQPGVRFASWDHDAAVTDDAYNDSDPTVVAAEIADATSRYAATLRALGGDQWASSGERSDGEIFTIDSLARYGLHEAKHHQLDIGRGLRSARGR